MRLIVFLLAIASAAAATSSDSSPMLTLHAHRLSASSSDATRFTPTDETIEWNPERTALIVVDMWDDHWCRGAAQRVVELARPINTFIARARAAGVLVVHCPSTCVDFYKDSPARRRAQQAPYAQAPVPLASEQRWGTAWDYPDEPREPPMPIDDWDMGCDCEVKCKIAGPWTRQHAAVEINDQLDVVTDNGQELYNVFAERRIDNVMICGVHLNMCVLGRPVGIRQLVKMGKNVVLVRDLTDTMYNHEMLPRVDHFAGTDLVVEHVEKYWCPTIVSADLTGQTPFRFAARK
jgi:nicotinamidase-related amidase